MQRKRILFLGFGDIALRASEALEDCDMVGVARSPKRVPGHVTFFQGAADSIPVCEKLRDEHWDAVVITLTPTEFSDKAYEVGYVQTLQHVLNYAQKNPPGLILFASSTSVYPQAQGEWVDELTVVEPQSFSGRRLLEAEQLLASSGLPHCSLRFAGIYGPGRTMMIRQAQQGQGGSTAFTNRIHADDCGGFIAFLIQRVFAGQMIDSLYLVCDGHPVSGMEVRQWIAEQLGLGEQPLTANVSERGGNKRCSNSRMLDTGYQLKYPDFRSGYAPLLVGISEADSAS